MPRRMQQLQKHHGVGNVVMGEAEVPTPAADEILVKVRRSLISRGSELFRRYVLEEALEPSRMGYSDAGDVADIGKGVTGFSVGDQVMIMAPHAQYVARPANAAGSVTKIPSGISYEQSTFLPLARSSVGWMKSTPVNPGDTVVVVGQGLVGNLCAQAVRMHNPGRVIGVDVTDLRCRIAGASGLDEVINAAGTDPVEAVLRMTDGKGADVVVDAVGGNAGIESFRQSQKMVSRTGVVHLVSKYQAGDGVPGSGIMSLDSGTMQRKLLLIGYFESDDLTDYLTTACDMFVDGRIDVEPLITQRMPYMQTPDAYHLLYNHPDEALGVIIEWD